MFLHCSYSAPVRVSDIAPPVCDAAREITRFDVARATRGDDAFRAVSVVLLRGDGVVALREDNTRWGRAAVVRRGVVAVRIWVCFLSFCVLEMAFPSRTAALAIPMQHTIVLIKTRNFFISGGILANF